MLRPEFGERGAGCGEGGDELRAAGITGVPGGAVGLAVISAVAASYTASLTREGGPQALTSGYNLAMAVAAGLTLLASVIAATVIRVRQPAPAATSLTDGTGRDRQRSPTP